MSRATFPAAARLHRPTEFAAALSGRRIARGAFFVVTAHSPVHLAAHLASQTPTEVPNLAPIQTRAVTLSNSLIQPTATNDQSTTNDSFVASDPLLARLGLIMAKRFAHHASTRNALKRVIRESFRTLRLNLPPKDYVVRLHKSVGKISLSELKSIARQEADAHFKKAQQ